VSQAGSPELPTPGLPQTGTAAAKAAPRRSTLLLLLGAALVLALRLWVIEPIAVVETSMEPTVPEGSTALLSKLVPAQISPGTLVVFPSPEDGADVLKRVVATEGSTVAIKDAVLYVNDFVIDEPFVDHSRIDATYFGPVTVAEGHVFVLGDNRAVSIDSRDYGDIPVGEIKATVIWPRS
jgi:signal peptidase I